MIRLGLKPASLMRAIGRGDVPVQAPQVHCAPERARRQLRGVVRTRVSNDIHTSIYSAQAFTLRLQGTANEIYT